MAQADVLVSIELADIAKKLSALLDEASGGHHMAFTLMVWSTEPNGRMSYIANCDRHLVKSAMEDMLKKWSTPEHGGPAHVYN